MYDWEATSSHHVNMVINITEHPLWIAVSNISHSVCLSDIFMSVHVVFHLEN